MAKIPISYGSLHWRCGENGRLPVKSLQKLIDDLRSSNVIEELVERLARCSWVDHVDLDIGLWAPFVREQDAIDYDWPIEEWAAGLDALEGVWHKGNIQVADIFLASDILASLRRLSNVRSWCIELNLESLYKDPVIVHEKMTLDLSNGITQKR